MDLFNLKVAQIDAKFEVKIDQISIKLDSIERFVHLNSEEVLEKLIKYDDRDAVFESHVKSHIINIENLMKHSLDASTNIKEIVSHNLGNLDKVFNIVKDWKLQRQTVISQLGAIDAKLQVYFSSLIIHSVSLFIRHKKQLFM